MKTRDLYDKLKTNNKSKIVIIKEGIFYKSFSDDALILSYIFEYKYINGCTSFGEAPYDKVINRLRGLDIGYLIHTSDDLVFRGDNDVYDNYRSLALKKYEKEKNYLFLKDKIDLFLSLDSNNYDKLMNFINSNM